MRESRLHLVALLVSVVFAASCDSRSLDTPDAGTGGKGGTSAGTGGAGGSAGAAGGAGGSTADCSDLPRPAISCPPSYIDDWQCVLDATGVRRWELHCKPVANPPALCSADSQCPAGQYCALPCGPFAPGERVAGTCADLPTACTKELAPVCGCDGNTYGNDCMRRMARAGLQHAGPCESPPVPACGGFGGATCGKSQFCELPSGTCGAADQSGVCQTAPAACDLIYAPVCGCDGKTYDNDCARQSAGTSKYADGSCRLL